jgi:hypothetical protein
MGKIAVFSASSRGGCLFLIYKQMLIGRMGGLGNRGKKKTTKNGAKTRQNISEI